MRALPLSRTARRRFELDAVTADAPAPAQATTRSRLAANLPAARRVVAKVNATRRAGEPSAQAGELAALELLHEISHILVERAAELQPRTSMSVTADAVTRAVGAPRAERLLGAVAAEFPDVEGAPTPARLEEMLLVRLANENPAARPLGHAVEPLVDGVSQHAGVCGTLRGIGPQAAPRERPQRADPSGDAGVCLDGHDAE